jgi:16S rRNA (guanine966-N2)-methyltransferase
VRIVGGRFRGRRLTAPAGRDLRPTSDRAREAAFNILAHGFEIDLEGLELIDVFAGTGAMGLEALSRGAARVTFIDDAQAALDCVRRNAGAVGVARQVTLLKLDATHLPPPPLVAGAPCPLAFLDAPYDSGLSEPALESLAAAGWIAAGSLCTVELSARERFAAPAGFEVADDRHYGAARILFLTKT